MKYLKVALVFIACCLAALGIVLFFTGGYRSELSKASEKAFITGNYMYSEMMLNRVRDDIPAAQYYLYMGYVEREKSSLQESNKMLELAEQNAKNEPLSRIRLEIYLNQALNAFLTLNTTAMAEAVSNAKAAAVKSGNDWITFFNTLQEFQKGNTQQAIKEWQQPLRKGFLSPWMKKTFEDLFFNDDWYLNHLVQAYIAKGDRQSTPKA